MRSKEASGNAIGSAAGGGEHLGGGVDAGAAPADGIVQRNQVVAGAAADFEDGGVGCEGAGSDQVGEDAGMDPAMACVVGGEAVVVEGGHGAIVTRGMRTEDYVEW